VGIRSEGVSATAWATNVSESGMYVRLSQAGDLAVGAHVHVSFSLPTGGPSLHLRAVVAWVGAAMGCGLRFDEGQEPALERLREFVRTFRYRVCVLDFEDVELLRRAIGDLYEIVEVGDAAVLWRLIETATVGLIVASPNRVDAVLTVSVDRRPPVIFSGGEGAEVLAPLLDRGGIVFRALPVDSLELRSLCRQMVDAHVLVAENERLTRELEGMVERLRRENQSLRRRVPRPIAFEGMIGECEGMRRVFEAIEKVAPLTTTVVVEGETGTGKDLVARALHTRSPRAKEPFCAVNCAALPETLLDAELFGHAKGAFTGAAQDRPGLFEAAHGGTLFLDEIGEMTPSMQAKLLRAVQSGEVRRLGETRERKVDVRLVCATHRDLPALVAEGKFRQDLLYRVRTFVIRLPPVRERRSDIQALTDHFLAEVMERHGVRPSGLTPEARRILETHDWPGNARELENAVERTVIAAGNGRPIDATLVAEVLDSPRARAAAARSLDEVVTDYERQLVVAELERQGGILARAARALRVDRTTLSKRCKRLGIVVREPEAR
jgi:DNA-binding NtrC family response regulator